MEWATDALAGPDGEDWRVPTSELATRQSRLISILEGKSHLKRAYDPVEAQGNLLQIHLA